MKYIVLLLLLVASCAQLPKQHSDKYSILQGVTNSKEVEFSVLADTENLRFELRDSEGEILQPDETKIVTRSFSKWMVHKIVFVRDAQKDYNLYVYEGEKIVDQRLVGRGQKEQTRLRIAVASCMSDHFPKDFKIWDTLASKNPEYLLMIGDNVYADINKNSMVQAVDPELLWKRYVETRLALPVYFQKKLIPVHATWDDHDYGINDGNVKWGYKKEAKEIFDAFFAQDMSDDDYYKGHGVGGMLSLGDFNLYFLDGRTFRSDIKEGTHLGLDQTAWLISKLREESSPSFIIKGDQFFGGYHKFESFEGSHPNDFQQFVAELTKINTPFIFLSGDRHMSEIMQFPRGMFGKPSFEITSSPIHSKVYPDRNDQNPWRVVSENAHPNFTIIDNLAQNDHWFLEIENFGVNGEPYYRREVAVFIKDLQNNLNEARKRRVGKRRYKKVRVKRSKRR